MTRRVDGPVPANSVIAILLTNSGNGNEAFRLAATGDGDTPVGRFAIDTDGDGRYSPGRDTLLPDAVTPTLPLGATLPLLLIDAAPGDRAITIVARAVTGTGAPGASFPGRGDEGADAVAGPTGAEARLVIGRDRDVSPALSKTQTVVAPDGSARAVRDAVVTYTLLATFAGATPDARIEDPVPAGTRYLPGSLRLDGAALSDSADDDAGRADGTTIDVALGDIAAAGVRTLQFQVRIQ